MKNLWITVDHIQDNVAEYTLKFNKFANHMVTMSNLEKERVDKISKSLVITMQGLNELKDSVEGLHILEILNDAYQEMIHDIFMEAIQVISMMVDTTHNYLSVVQERCLALATLNNHLLSPSLITPADLSQALTDVEQVLLRDYAPFKFAFSTIDYFYSVPSTSYLADEHYLYVEIKIPLTILSAYYQVYEVHTVPMTIGQGHTQYTQIKNLPQKIGFSSQGDTHVILDDNFLKTCEGIGIQRCYHRRMESSTLVPSCILGLFIDDAKMIQTHCKADFILTPSLPETAIDIGHGQFFISAMNTTDHWTISCSGRKPRALVSCKSCVITLDCKCNLKTPNSFISASLNNCPKASSSSGLTKTFIPNFTWLQNLPKSFINFTKYKNHALYDHDPGNFLLQSDIPTYDDIASYVAYDTEVKTGLDHVMTQAENKQKVYVSQYQRLSEDNHFMGLRVNYAFPLALTGLAWNAVLTSFLVIISRKRYASYLMGTLAAGLNKPAAASFLYPSETDSTYTFCLWYLVIIISLYIIVVFIWKFLKHKKEQRCKADEHYPTKIHETVSSILYFKFWTPFIYLFFFVKNIFYFHKR